MNKVLLFKDIVRAIGWLLARITPLVLMLVAMFMDMSKFSDAPVTTAMLIIGWLVLSTYVIYGFTNSWPVLFWRYQKTHEIRTITLNGNVYHQIKLFGIWYLIQIVGDSEVVMTIAKSWTPFMIFSNTQHYFVDKFTAMIKARQAVEDSRAGPTMWIVNGRRVD